MFKKIEVAIVDYGLGNLFSVAHACEKVGLAPVITNEPRKIIKAAGVVLPGVGAFGIAMDNLNKLGINEVLCQIASDNKPIFGICLGMQLLMSASYEFGFHKGLGLISGDVVSLGEPIENNVLLKVPQVQWNKINILPFKGAGREYSLLEGVPDASFMYFVHSYIVKPIDMSVVISITNYGDVAFCSSFQKGNLFACQFHPERSGESGLKLYHNFAKLVARES